jgi:hypothetical protein
MSLALLAGASVALTGCSADTLSGPGIEAYADGGGSDGSEHNEKGGGGSDGSEHNEKGGGGSDGSEHNEGNGFDKSGGGGSDGSEHNE